MKNMLYGIGLLMSGSIDMAIPFLLFCALAIIGFIVSTKEYSNQNHS